MDERADTLFGGGQLAAVRRTVRVVFGDVLSTLDREIYDGSLKPKHGPGATADSLKGNQKWMLPTWHDRLEPLFPLGEYGVSNPKYAEEAYCRTSFLDPWNETSAKLTDVPKTHTTPRLIAEEPTCMQYVQQAISSRLVELLEQHRLDGHTVENDAEWFVGFTQQWPNQALACIGSEDGSLATLDLSEASDRVANWLVEELFADYPFFLEGIQACRSTTARLPSGEVIPLLKFASMGSALTFPIEAMVFAAVVLTKCVQADGLPQARASYRKFRDRVRVFGDDIIVPTPMAETVIEYLELFGFKVNRNKSFWTGEFRESCGKEYWNGLDVSIVRFRKELPTSRRDVDRIVTTSATRNHLYSVGMIHTAALLDDVLERVIRHYPYVTPTSPIIGRHHPLGYYQVDSVGGDYQAPRTKGWVVAPKIPNIGIDGHGALLKCLLTTIGNANVDEEHLSRSGRPRAASMKLVKAPPF
jgi:hypothetical protein